MIKQTSSSPIPQKTFNTKKMKKCKVLFIPIQMASNFSFSNDAKNSADLKKNQNTPPKQILFRTSFSSKYLNQKRKWI